MKDVELIYDADCPNVQAARSQGDGWVGAHGFLSAQPSFRVVARVAGWTPAGPPGALGEQESTEALHERLSLYPLVARSCNALVWEWVG